MHNINNFLCLSAELEDKYGVHLPTPTVLLLGSYNTGKSTLINGLLNTPLSPVDIIPSTKGPISFKYGEKFLAVVYTGKFKTKRFNEKKDFIRFAKAADHNDFQWAEVYLKSPLLKKLTLIDTPGLDGPFINDVVLEKLLKKANQLIYLFHQRGIEEFNKRFLLKLSGIYKQKKQIEISFWLNCNLGNFDGSSLEETRSVIKAIFPGQPKLYTINTIDPQNRNLLQYYLETVISEQVLKQVKKVMLQKDRELVQNINRAASAVSEAEFLLNFAKTKHQAEQLILDEKKINETAQAPVQLREVLNINNKLNINENINFPLAPDQSTNYLNLSATKDLLLNLIYRILHGSASKLIDQRALKKLAEKIKKEHFSIVAAGGFSSGKSTFFNALMGEEILPAQSRPTTFTITKISHGPYKRAVVHFASRVTMQLYDRVNGKIEPRSDELNTLAQWLIRDNTNIISYELYKNRHFKQVSRQECLDILKDLKRLSGRSAESLSQWAVYRILPSKLAESKKLTEKIRLTFKKCRPVNFELSGEAGRKAFYSTINCTNAFRVERVEVYHPAEYLKLASFLDTPGLDSTHKYHTEITTDYLQNCDAYLVFLNARHLLINQGGNPIEMISNRLRDYLKTNPKAFQKIFFVLNFADTLTRLEREKTRQFIKSQISIPGMVPEIHTISSLSALLKRDNGSFKRFLNSMEKAVLNYRGKDILTGYVKEIRYILNTAINTSSSSKINNINTGHELNLIKDSLAQQVLNNKSSLLIEINSRFEELSKLTGELKNERDFIGFVKGSIEQKKGLIFKATEKVNHPSYFRWLTSLNNYIAIECQNIIEQIENSIKEHLRQIPDMSVINLNIIPPPALQVSPVLREISAGMEKNRGLFGRMKEPLYREIKELFTREYHTLIAGLDLWEQKVLNEIATKLETVKNTRKKPGAANEIQSPVLKEYLDKLKEIQTLLDSPGR